MQAECGDRGGDDADDPDDVAGSHQDFGFGTRFYHAIDDSGQDIAGAQADDRASGDQDIVGPDADDRRRADRSIERGDDQERASDDLKRRLGMALNGHPGLESVAQPFKRDARRSGENIERRTFIDDRPRVEPEEA